jgi:hypothetical protein
MEKVKAAKDVRAGVDGFVSRAALMIFIGPYLLAEGRFVAQGVQQA